MKQKSALMLIVISLMFLGLVPVCVAGAEIKIMPFGDSITEGIYGSAFNVGYRRSLYLSLTAAGCNVNFVGGLEMGIPTDFDRDHEGHSGLRADQAKYDIFDWLTVNPADIVLLHIGTNDITQENEDAAEVNEILDEIDRYSENTTVVLAARIILRTDGGSPRTIALNDAVEAMALDRIANGDDIIIVDMENALTYPDDLSDTRHPNDSGYAKMADVWRNALFDYFAPVITSTPKTEGIVGGLYTYDVNAIGYPDEPNYILLEHPSGMTIDPDTGLIEWTPLSTGDFNATVKARNNIADANQNFAITVLAPDCDIAFESMETADTMGNATNLMINKPVGTEEGDLLIAILSKDGPGAINTPTGWTLIDEGADEPNKIRIGVFYLVAEPSEPNSYTIYYPDPNEAVGAILRYSGVDITGPVNISASSSGSGMSASAPSVTTTVDNTVVLRLVGAAGNTLDATSHPVEHTGLFAITSSGNKIGGAAADPNVSQALAGATGAATFSLLSTGEWRAVTVAIAPARMLIVAGHVRDPRGVPIEGVLVDPNNNGAVADTTDVNGFYELWMDYKWSGTVTPQRQGYYFDPNEIVYANVVDDHTDMDFMGIRNEDINIDGFIDESELWYIVEYWLQPNPPEGDFFDDNFMNFLDFVELADVWGG